MLLPDNYKKIFEEFYEEENGYFARLLQGDFSIHYQFGFLFGKLQNKDQRIIDLLNDIKSERLSDEKFQNFITHLEKAKNNKERKLLIQKIEEYEKIGQRDYISLKKLEFTNAYLDGLNFNKIANYHKAIYDSLNSETNIFNCSSEDYIIFIIIELLYEFNNHSLKRFQVPKGNNLEKLYSSKKISLQDIDVQYNKYDLLTIDDNFEISESNIPKVYDKRIDSYVLIKEIPINLLLLFKDLRAKDFIKSMALRPDYYIAGEGFVDLSIALEELERGEIFSFDKLGSPSISKLYSKAYDNLWIIIDNRNITFEEILQDFDVYNDNVVTQVIHLEYTIKKATPLITHIDHEYIFYSLDEYERRLSDYTQKGNAKKRFKTFKIDRSEIPFYVNDCFILYYILDKYFRKTELLNEYFEGVLKI